MASPQSRRRMRLPVRAAGMLPPVVAVLALLLACSFGAVAPALAAPSDGGTMPAEAQDLSELERNNWVVLVQTSRYWYNYRHTSNVLTFYHTVKRMGIPDSQIILMMAEDAPCNPRNKLPGIIYNDGSYADNLYGEDVEVDYRGEEVSVENFIRLLTGRHPPNTPRNKRLLTDSMSNVLIFASGHSGEEFIKFQDWEEITSNDIADAFGQMHKQRRYRKIFWITDTCQAASLQNVFYSPEILAMGSSGQKESSYAKGLDSNLGVALVDRWTFYASGFFDKLKPSSPLTVEDFTKVKYFVHKYLSATPELRTDLFSKRPNETRMSEFFASTGRMRFQTHALDLRASPDVAVADGDRGLGGAAGAGAGAARAAGGAAAAAPPWWEELLPPPAASLLSALLAAAASRPAAAFSAALGGGGASAPAPAPSALAAPEAGAWLLGLGGAAAVASLVV